MVMWLVQKTIFYYFFSERIKRKMLINCRELGGGLSLQYRLEHLSCEERARDRDSCSLEKRWLQGHLTAVLQSNERQLLKSISEETVLYATSCVGNVYCLLICGVLVLQKTSTGPNSVISMLKVNDYIIIRRNVSVWVWHREEKKRRA